MKPLTFLVGNLPDISNTPRFYNSSASIKERYSNWVDDYNFALEGALAGWSGGNVYLLDTYQLFSTYDPAIDWDEWKSLFYDGMHPSSTGHELLAENACILLAGDPSYPAAVPVPGTMILMISGLAMFGWTQRRQSCS